MTDQEMTLPGWYDDGSGRQRWFDGNDWGHYAKGFCGECGSPCGEEAFCAQCGHSLRQKTAAPASPREDDEQVVVRRTRRSPFVASSPEQVAQASGITVSRNWGLGLRSSASKKDSGMTRNRKIAGDLPEWSPLPPGELSVDRRGGTHP